MPADDPQVMPRQISESDGGLIAALQEADLPPEDLNEGGRRFYRFDMGRQPVGYGGFERHGADALVRSIVLPDDRGRRLGRAISGIAFSKVVAAACSEAYLLTTSAAEFCEHLGFTPIQRRMAPGAILETRQAATICSTAAMLTRHL